jgi:hypothetical protein
MCNVYCSFLFFKEIYCTDSIYSAYSVYSVYKDKLRGVHMVLVGKPKGRRPLGRPRRRWEDNIKMDLQEVGGGCGN